MQPGGSQETGNKKIPSSKSWLPVIMNAMKDGKALTLTYQSFWKNEPSTYQVDPWCLKLFKQRWYMLAKSEGYDEPRIYALDRIHNAMQMNEKLEMPKNFNANEFFSRHFGIILGDGAEMATVKLKVEASQVKYFESLPLHHTQKAVEVTPDYTVYQYRLVPTYDFHQEVMSKGGYVEVLAPENFRKEIADDVASMMKLYKKKK